MALRLSYLRKTEGNDAETIAIYIDVAVGGEPGIRAAVAFKPFIVAETFVFE